ncbi:MAG: cupin domain-containing protein [Dongiaceae bacterium]
MTSARLMRIFLHVGGDGLDDWGDIPAADLVSGAPKQRGRYCFNAPHVGLSAGVWDCTAFEGKMAPYSVDEFMMLLEGSVTVTEANGKSTRVTAGESFVIPRGLDCAWKQEGYVRKIFVIYENPAEAMPARPAAEHVVKLDLKTALVPCDAPDPALLNGPEPRCAEHVVYTDVSGQLTIGLWSATPYDRKATPFGRYELMHFLDGQVDLHDGGTSGQAFQAGETIFVPKGVPLGWRNKTDVKKIFVILMPNR